MSKNGTLFFERSFIPKIFWLKFDVTSALVKNIHHKVIWGITRVSSMTICHFSSGQKIDVWFLAKRPETYSIAMATTHWVSFCFLPDVHYWCQV